MIIDIDRLASPHRIGESEQRHIRPTPGAIDGEEAEPPVIRGDLRLDLDRFGCTWQNSPVDLTVTEFLILKALAQHPGHVKSRDQLMDAAYGESIYVDDRTIDSHIKRLRKKFRAADTGFSEIETMYGIGYRYREGQARSRAL